MSSESDSSNELVGEFFVQLLGEAGQQKLCDARFEHLAKRMQAFEMDVKEGLASLKLEVKSLRDRHIETVDHLAKLNNRIAELEKINDV